MFLLAHLLNLMVFLVSFCCTHSASSEIYHISPTLVNESCPARREPCVTLSQFAANSSQYLQSNTTLVLLEEDHTLNTQLTVEGIVAFSIYSGQNVTCVNESVIYLRNISNVHLHNMIFIGCRVEVQVVDNFFIKNNYFIDFDATFDEFRVLQLTLTNANILNTRFSGISLSSNITSYSGILKASHSNVTIQGITLENCEANFGLAFYNSTVMISHSNFNDNEVNSAEIEYRRLSFIGGVLYSDKHCTVTVTSSTFTYNNIKSLSERNYVYLDSVVVGGVIVMLSANSVEFEFCNFLNNAGSGDLKGGAIHIQGNQFVTSGATIYIHGCTFTNNSAFAGGAVYVDSFQTNLNISDSSFIANTAHGGGGGAIFVDTRGNVNISGCIFWNNFNLMRASSNTVDGNGGAVFCDVNAAGDLKLVNSNFTNNEAAANGGAVYVYECNKAIVQESFFFHNKANGGNGGALVVDHFRSNMVITGSTHINNMATGDGGGLYVRGRSYSIDSFIITSSCFHSNQAKTGDGGALALVYVAKVTVSTNKFYRNLANNGGALYVISGSSDSHCSCMNSEHSSIANISECVFSFNKAVRGGAIYMAGSQPVYISSSKIFTENLAEYGGAVFSNSGRLYISNEVKMTNNTADTSGGAVYLNNSKMICQDRGRITLEMNMAKAKGGGICSSNSFLIINSTVKHPHITSSSISFLLNHGKEGGGLYLCKGSIISIINYQMSDSSAINFTRNTATFGSNLFILDSTSGDGATHMSDLGSQTECFIQVSPPHNLTQSVSFNYAVYFELSQANFESQLNVLKTRFATCRVNEQLVINESEHLKAISNLQDVNIGSLLLTLCFCRYGLPDCSYSPPPVEAIQNTIGIEVAMVDQFYHAYNAKIEIEVDSTKGTISKEQGIQRTNMRCTKFEFDVYSSLYDQEIIMSPIRVMPPYQYIKETKRKFSLHYQPCKICPIGFQKFMKSIRGCQCDCDEVLINDKHLTGCNYAARTVTKQHTTAWISHYSININSSSYSIYPDHINSSGYLIYPYCPHNYCLPPETRVEIDLNIPNGADAQCSNNRGGLLCGSCINGSTLSLGSTHCIECDTHWPVVLVVLIISGIVGGIILVASFLVLNLTVAVGTLNGIIFYANIVAANGRTFFPSRHFLTVFLSWINLELGIDTCLFEGMDAYWKTWIELALPTYLIALVIIIIIVSEKSMRFSNLIGKKNPVATLDTIVLLSYGKFLRVIISSYSLAILDYPNHSRRLVWLPDATLQYFSGKHIPLIITATLVLLVGVAYTSLLLSWQWLLRYQDVKCLAWIRNQHLRLFIVPYHAPYKPKHRYWTGLLLLVRIVVYIISAGTLSMDHTISIIAIGIATSILLMLSTNRRYNKRPIEVIEVISFTNISCLCLATVFLSKGGNGQDIVACISGSITFIMFLIVLSYHILTELCFKTKFGKALKQKFRRHEDTEEYEPKREEKEERMPLTFSEVPAPRGDSDRAKGKGEIPHTKCTDTFELKVKSFPNDPVPYHLMQ